MCDYLLILATSSSNILHAIIRGKNDPGFKIFSSVDNWTTCQYIGIKKEDFNKLEA